MLDDGFAARGSAAVLAALITTTALFAYAPAVFGPPFYTKGEPREAVVVATMSRGGDWLLPRRSENELARKPPLFHWLGFVASRICGRLDEGVIRLPSLFASAATVALTTASGAALGGPAVGAAAGAILFTSQQWVVSSVTARVDMVLAACISAALWSFLGAYRARRPWSLGFCVAAALAVLTKGPIGYALPFLITVGFLVCVGDLAYLRTIARAGTVLALSLPAFWYLAAWVRGGNEFFEIVVAENLLRMVDPEAGAVGHTKPIWYYVPALMGGFAPWTLLGPGICSAFWRVRRGYFDERRLFYIVWCAATVAFFSLAGSKRGVYLLPCYPALALLTADLSLGAPARGRIGGHGALVWSGCAAAALMLATAVLAGAQSRGLPALGWLAPWLGPSDAANLRAVAESLQRHETAVSAWATAVVVASAWLITRARAASIAGVIGSMALLAGCTIAFAGATIFRDLAATQSIKPLILAARAKLEPHDPLVFFTGGDDSAGGLYFFQAFQYAAGFYGQRELRVVDDLDELAASEVRVFLTPAPVFAELRRPRPRGGRAPARVRAVMRYTYGGNPKRVPVVLVRMKQRRS